MTREESLERNLRSALKSWKTWERRALNAEASYLAQISQNLDMAEEIERLRERLRSLGGM